MECSLGAEYLMGAFGGLLVGWIAGQYWQAFHDQRFVKTFQGVLQRAISGKPVGEIVEFSSPTGPESEEITELFESTSERGTKRPRTTQEILDVGRKKGAEPVRFPVAKGGGYVTNSEINKVSKKSQEYHENKLSRADELEIIQTFSGIKGMGYYPALGIVEEQGYSLYPVYVNNGPKTPSNRYSATVLGVKIRDPEFDPDGAENAPSRKATIVDIVDVGGQDLHNRGNIQVPLERFESKIRI